MGKFLSIVGVLAMVTAAHGEQLSPWFGGEAATPLQLDATKIGNNTTETSQIRDCTIISCKSMMNIENQAEKTATNP